MKIKWTTKRTLITVALLVGVLWLYAMGSEKRAEEGKDGGTSSNGSQCRVEAVVDGLNVRSAPTVAPNNVVGEMNRGDQSDADKTVEQGFRKLAEDRWVSAEFVRAVSGDC
ncbi:MAG TPA: SH3 domain-containing protein [Actinophytocola sp.]|uniref:SH3 domain-containing protein n=1 Tax=Actinophytocola sp. TaxID=1872138 RepID=UPI002F92B6AA